MGCQPSNMCGKQIKLDDLSQFSESLDFGTENSLESIHLSNIEIKLVHQKTNFPEFEYEQLMNTTQKLLNKSVEKKSGLKSCMKQSLQTRQTKDSKKVQFNKTKQVRINKTTIRGRKNYYKVCSQTSPLQNENKSVEQDHILIIQRSPLKNMIFSNFRQKQAQYH